MKEFKNRLQYIKIFVPVHVLCMYGNALNVEEGALDRLAECPDQSAPYRGPLPEGLHRRGPSRGPHLRVPTRGPPSEHLNQGLQQT